MAPSESSVSPLVRSIIIGTAGHIDHGKTALVRALTGIDTDRLPEEKRRGITIDLGFASFDAQARDGSALQISLIDVPGHARFVRNMLAGAGGIDAVLLTIAADEGVMPQTREHLAICSLLGIKRGIVAVTKSDAVSDERLIEATNAIRHFLEGTFLASAPLMAVSARSGSGVAKLRSQLAGLALGLSEGRPDAVVRLPIDRAFVIKGFGTVVTGTLIGGAVRTGNDLEMLPGGRIVRVRGIQVHNRAEEQAFAGSRVALNLAHVETAEIARGHTLVSPASTSAVDTIDVELSMLPGAAALKHRARVHFHAFASESLASVMLYDATLIGPGETRPARLRLCAPIVLLPQDRFVLRAGTPITTIGGGRVLDAHPLAKQKKAKTAGWLRDLSAASSEERVWLRIARRGIYGVSAYELTQETGMTARALGGLVRAWIQAGRMHCAGEKRWLTQESFAVARELVLRQTRERIEGSSEGVRRSELREQSGLEAEIFEDALRRIILDREFQVAGEFVMRCTPVAKMPDRDDSLLAAVAQEYALAGMAPPYPDELAVRLGIAPAEMHRLITLLLRGRRLVRLNNESLCFDERALAALAEKIRALRGQLLDVAAFKKLTGVSRKFAIPLLEYLDRERVTIRRGDRRLVL